MDDSPVPYINCTTFTHSQFRRLPLARGITALVCLLPCLLTLGFIWYKRMWQFLHERLFLWLTISTVAYLAVLTMHMEHYFHYLHEGKFCQVIGFLDQSTGSVQLLFTLEIALYLLYEVMSRTSLCKQNACTRCFKNWYRGLKCKIHPETFLFTFSLMFPFAVAVIPFYLTPYGEAGPSSCWIKSLGNGCHHSKQGFWEQLGLWYIPVSFVALCSFISILLTVSFLLFQCYKWVRQQNQMNERDEEGAGTALGEGGDEAALGEGDEEEVAPAEQGTTNVSGDDVVDGPNRITKRLAHTIADSAFLLCFLSIYCVLCGIEIAGLVSARKDVYWLWMLYAVSTPISGAIIPVAFLLYWGREEIWSAMKSQSCRNLSRCCRNDHQYQVLQVYDDPDPSEHTSTLRNEQLQCLSNSQSGRQHGVRETSPLDSSDQLEFETVNEPPTTSAAGSGSLQRTLQEREQGDHSEP